MSGLVQHDFQDKKAWYDDEAGFAEELARGRKTQFRVAMRLMPLGLWIRVGMWKVRNGIASRDPECQNDKDVEIEDHMLEIKGRALRFEGASDYPFDTVFLGAKRRWDGREKKPCAVVVVSEITSAMLVIPYSTSHKWTENKTLDKRRGFIEHGLGAPLDCIVSWERLVKHVSEKCRLNE